MVRGCLENKTELKNLKHCLNLLKLIPPVKKQLSIGMIPSLDLFCH